MKTHAHTPGPWVSDDRHPEDIGRYVMAGLSPICRLSLQGPLMRVEAEANARLIAAAPELLAACRALACEDLSGLELINRIDAARAAIAKATGATNEA